LDEADAGVIHPISPQASSLSRVRTTGEDRDFQDLVRQLDADLNQRYAALQKSYDAHNASRDLAHVVLLYENQTPIGCGAFKALATASAEIKRMFVKPEARGRGMASMILAELEAWAREEQMTSLVLETGQKQHEAIALYLKLGYQPIENYGPYVGHQNSRCFRKALLGNQR